MTKRDPQELYDFIQNHKGPYGPYSTKKDYTNLKVIIKYLNNYYDHIKSYSTHLKNFYGVLRFKRYRYIMILSYLVLQNCLNSLHFRDKGLIF